MICCLYKKGMECGAWRLGPIHPSILCFKIRIRKIINDNPRKIVNDNPRKIINDNPPD
jgi:hypothetical protein